MLVKIILLNVVMIGDWSMLNRILIQGQPASVKNTLRILPAKNGLSEGGSYNLDPGHRSKTEMDLFQSTNAYILTIGVLSPGTVGSKRSAVRYTTDWSTANFTTPSENAGWPTFPTPAK